MAAKCHFALPFGSLIHKHATTISRVSRDRLHDQKGVGIEGAILEGKFASLNNNRMHGEADPGGKEREREREREGGGGRWGRGNKQ